MGAKAAGTSIQVLAQCLGNDFEALALKLVQKDALMKVLHNGNKTLSEIGHNCVLCILNHVCVPKLIQVLPAEMASSKSPLVLAKLSQYLFVIVTLYPFENVLDRNGQHVDQYIKQCVANPNSEARQNGRKSFLIWQKLAPDNAQALFAVLDYGAQKAIVEEQDKFGELDEIVGADAGHAPRYTQSANLHSSTNTNATSNYSNSMGGARNPASDSRPVQKATQEKKGYVRTVSSNSNNRKSHHSKGSRSGISNQRQSFGVFSQDSSQVASNKSGSRASGGAGALNVRKQNSANVNQQADRPSIQYGQNVAPSNKHEAYSKDGERYPNSYQVDQANHLLPGAPASTAYSPAPTRYSQNSKYMNPFNQNEEMPLGQMDQMDDQKPIDFYNVHHGQQQP